MAMLGTFILLFGWFGFNAASTFGATDNRFTIIATNTAIAAAFGAVAAMFWVMMRAKKPDPGMMANGMLAGLVAITAPCAFVQPWAASAIGIVMFGIAFAFFKIQNALMKGGIRPSREVELQGVDIPEMGVLAYPEFYGSSPHVEMPDHEGLIELPEPVPAGQERSR